jgi:hypothetical protein
MRLSIVMFLTILYIVGFMISNTCEQKALLGTAQTSLIGGLLTPPVTDWTSLSSAVGSLISIPVHYIGLMVKIATFDFSFFYGTWAFVRLIFCAIGLGMIVGWVTVLRGVHST